MDRDLLHETAYKTLKKGYGEEFAERFSVWKRLRNGQLPLPLVILIGGTSGAGKSSVGVALANRLRITRVVSSDAIRNVMRQMIAPDLIPALHESSFTAWQRVQAPTPTEADPVIHAFREQAARVGVGVRAVIERAVEENTSLILDGVHLVPGLISLEPFADQALFIWINLHLSDERIYKDRFKSRGKEATRRPRHRYLENLEAIMKIQDHILEVGEAEDVPAFENIDFEDTVQAVALQIMDLLRERIKEKRNGGKS